MANPSASKKSLPAAIGGVVLLVVGSYVGVNLTDNDSDSSQAAPESSAAQKSQASPSATAHGSSGLHECPMNSLPEEAEETAQDILAGGPYEYPDNDNVRFGNYEGVLPQESKNYYREYTVQTPGAKNRGAKRIVTGGGTETDPDVWYYTDDHYESFCEIPDAE